MASIKMLGWTLQALAVTAALAAAYLWWRSSQEHLQTFQTVPKLAEGNIAFTTGPHEVLVWDLAKVAALNSWAAGLTAAAVLLEVTAALAASLSQRNRMTPRTSIG